MTRVIGRACAAILVTAMLAFRVGAVNDVPALLERGKPVERALSGGESHSYQIALGAGECAVVMAEQRGIDVSVRVSGPDSKTIADFDAESRPRGQERVEIVSDKAATYQVTVSARYPYDPAGAYALRVDDIHRSTDRDLNLDEARRLYTAMEPLRAAGKYADAAAGFTRAVQLAELASGATDPYVATLLLKLGAAQRGGGDGERAEQSFRRALEICDSSLGREHPQTGYALSILAVLYVSRDDYATAEPMMKEAVGILERTLGPDHPKVATALSDLADLHSYRGDEEHARAELERFVQQDRDVPAAAQATASPRSDNR
jgi:tetratricopeptide (TPR) repeat protein